MTRRSLVLVVVSLALAACALAVSLEATPGRRGGGPPSPAREKTTALLRQLMIERGIPIPAPAATPAPATPPRPAAGQ